MEELKVGSKNARLIVLVFGLLFTFVPLGVELYYIVFHSTIVLFLPFLVMFPGGIGALYAFFHKDTNWTQYD